MDKNEIAETLSEIGTILEIKGENPFKCRAFHNGARVLETLDGDLKELIESREISKVKGLGPSLVEKITEMVKQGKCSYLAELRETVPPGLLEMLEIPGLGPKKVKAVYEILEIKTVGELEYACLENRLVELEGFGKKTQEKILQGIAYRKKFQNQYLYSEAIHDAAEVLSFLESDPHVIRVSLAGSLRRHKETVKDVDLVASSKNPKKVMESFVGYKRVDEVIAKGETKSSVRLDSGLQVDLRVVTESEFPFALHHFTGSKEHNTALRSRAKKMNLKMNEYGLFRDDKPIPCTTEEEIFKALKLSFIPPEMREDHGEVEVSESGQIPDLVSEKDIRGIFHVHTTYSDGIHSLEEMVRAAERLGYEYIGISDHSKSARYANGLKEDDIRRQHEEIDRLNARGLRIKILKGIESDILGDGKLDYKDKVLESFDFIIASVHSGFSMPEAKMTDRIVTAMSHPLTTMLGHVTGRLLLSRPEYAVNMKKIIEAAAEHRVVIELNSNPHRLDIDWRHLKELKARNALASINPDAHRMDGLSHVHYGVGIARKGWLTPKDVLNTRPLNEMLAVLEKKH